MIDPRIALQVQPLQLADPVAQYGRGLQLRTLAGQQDLQALQMEEARQQRAERATLGELFRSALAPDGSVDRQRFVTGLAQSGLGARIPEAVKGFNELDRSEREARSAQLKLTSDQYALTAQRFGSLLARPDFTDEDVVRVGAELTQAGVMPPEQMRSFLASLPWGNPQALRARLQQGVIASLNAAKQVELSTPKPVEMTDGQRKFFRDTNPNSRTFGQEVGGPPVQMRLTPGEELSDSRIRSEGELNRGVQLRGQNMTDARARDLASATREATVTGRVPSGYRVAPDGQSLEPIPGGPADPARERQGNPTEDERKAAGWLQQADNAYRNILSVMSVDPGAARPAGSVGSAVGSFIQSVPIIGQSTMAQGLGNLIKPENRQRFEQASSSLAEALLRAATGAGVNENEARQKVQELTPRFGDSDGTVQQKIDAIPMYLRSLEARASRAAPQGYQVPTSPRAAPAVPSWSSMYPTRAAAVNDARTAIARGADKAEVVRRLEASGITDHGIR